MLGREPSVTPCLLGCHLWVPLGLSSAQLRAPPSRVSLNDCLPLMPFTRFRQETASPGKDSGVNQISPKGKWVPGSSSGSFVPSFPVIPSPHFSMQIIQLFLLSAS